ncbi:MAG: hypothetical protein ACPG77_12360, partial [Nannocystaceae bacterium]
AVPVRTRATEAATTVTVAPVRMMTTTGTPKIATVDHPLLAARKSGCVVCMHVLPSPHVAQMRSAAST